jgi:protease-4
MGWCSSRCCLFFALLYAFLSASPNPGAVEKGALLLELNGMVSEQPAAVDPIAAIVSQRAPVREHRQRDIVRALDLAVSDHRIKAVVLDLDRFMGGGQASLTEIGDRIDAVRRCWQARLRLCHRL